MKFKIKHLSSIGTSFDSFLAEQGLLSEVEQAIARRASMRWDEVKQLWVGTWRCSKCHFEQSSQVPGEMWHCGRCKGMARPPGIPGTDGQTTAGPS